MIGEPGPYMDDEGSVWVPRTVPWREVRCLARTGIDHLYANQRFVYVGKTDATLLGFTRDCPCEEVCEDAPRDEYGEPTGEPGPCRVPAWHFRIEERP